jgi:hypothetical protein
LFSNLILIFSLFLSLVHSWKYHYAAACLSVSVQRTFSVHRASYSSLLELDKRIRAFPLPSYLHSPIHGTEGRDWDTTPSGAMQQFFAACERESSERLSQCIIPMSLAPAHSNARCYRPYVHPQVMVRRGVTRLNRSAPARV